MIGRGILAPLTATPVESELPKIAGFAALLAAVPSAAGTLAHDGTVREFIPILALILLVTLGVFVWAVPSALVSEEPGPTPIAMTLSCLGLVTLLLFWTGLPAVLATGGIVLGRMQLDEPEDRRLALAATRVGAAAIGLYLLLSLADLL